MPRLRLLVVGVGSIGERHLRCFLATGRVEAQLVEINPALRQTVADRYGVPSAFARLEDALASVPPDLAVVATPAPAHIPIATALVEAGAAVLIEKPLSTSLDGIDRLKRLVADRQVVAGVAYVYRSHPLLGALREAVLQDRFGRPVQLVAVAGQHFPTYRPA